MRHIGRSNMTTPKLRLLLSDAGIKPAEVPNFISLAEGDFLAAALVPHIPDTTFCAQCIAIPRPVEFMPTLRPLPAPRHLPRQGTFHLVQT